MTASGLFSHNINRSMQVLTVCLLFCGLAVCAFGQVTSGTPPGGSSAAPPAGAPSGASMPSAASYGASPASAYPGGPMPAAAPPVAPATGYAGAAGYPQPPTGYFSPGTPGGAPPGYYYPYGCGAGALLGPGNLCYPSTAVSPPNGGAYPPGGYPPSASSYPPYPAGTSPYPPAAPYQPGATPYQPPQYQSGATPYQPPPYQSGAAPYQPPPYQPGTTPYPPGSTPYPQSAPGYAPAGPYPPAAGGAQPGVAASFANTAAAPQNAAGAMSTSATFSNGSAPSSMITAPSGTFTSGGVNSGGVAGSAAAGAAAQALGMSPAQIQSLQGQLSSGNISSEQMQSLTSRLAAMNLNPGDLASMGNALGLSSQQLSQIQQTIQASRQPAAPALPTQQAPYSAQQAAPQGAYASLHGGYAGPPGAAPGWPVPPPSVIESKFQQLDNPFAPVVPPTASNLTQFGYSTFMSQVSTFAPTQNVPVTGSYVLGPGDQLVVFTWGRVNAQLQLQVQNDGSVLIDQVGPLQVAGLTFSQAKKLIEGRLKQSTGVEVNVTMGQLRNIQVTVVGEANQPGTYTISALSHVSNGLLAAGGPAKAGSLRKIELRRHGKLVTTLDLYDVLINGDNGADAQLEQGDVIRVPVIGKVVGVAGEVKRPAIFELSPTGSEQLRDVIDRLAGGVTAFGYTGRLQVERIHNHQQVVVLDVPVKNMGKRNLQIKDGDLLKVLTVLPYHANTVMLSGNVFRPGEYQWRKGMRVADLIKEGQGVLPHTYFRYALIKRLEGPQRYTHFVQIDLAGALSGNSLANLYLKNHDELDVYSLDQLRDTPTVTVVGQVRIPGQYLLSERMRVSDLVYLAGGLKEDAYKPRAELVRVTIQNGHAIHHNFAINLADITSGPSNYDLVLKPNDQLFVSGVVQYQLPQRNVVVNGEVQNPGLYNFNQGMNIRDLVANAGGFKDDADKRRVELARTEVISGARTRRTFVQLDLRPGSPDLNYTLRFNDEVFVTVTPDWHLPWVVTVSGQVAKPGQYPIHSDERLSSLIARCGGFLPDAYPKALVFTRSSVQQMEQKELEEARQRISQELAQFSIQSAAMPAGTGNSGTGAAAVQATFASLQQLLATTQGQQADGRIVVRVDDMLEGHEGQNIVLQDGDNIAVPTMPASVSVLGQVYHPTSVVVRRSMKVSDYLYAAGGPTAQGDLDRLMVIKADGTVITEDGLKNSRQASLFPLLPVVSDGLMGQRLDPGDTVYVPESLANLQSVIRMKYWTDITTIISNSATTLAVVGLLATKL